MRPTKLIVAAIWLAGAAAATAQIDTSQYQRRQVGTANGQPIYINVNPNARPAARAEERVANFGGGDGGGRHYNGGGGGHVSVRPVAHVQHGGNRVCAGPSRSFHNCGPVRSGNYVNYGGGYAGGGYGGGGYGYSGYDNGNGGHSRCNSGPSRTTQCFGTGWAGRPAVGCGVGAWGGFGGGCYSSCGPFRGAASIGYASIPRYGRVSHAHRYCR